MKKQEKARIKLAEKLGAIFFPYPEYGVTLMLKRTGKDFGQISWSICSENDKFKKRTGKLVALDHFVSKGTLPIRWNEGWNDNKRHMFDCLDNLARTIS